MSEPSGARAGPGRGPVRVAYGPARACAGRIGLNRIGGERGGRHPASARAPAYGAIAVVSTLSRRRAITSFPAWDGWAPSTVFVREDWSPFGPLNA